MRLHYVLPDSATQSTAAELAGGWSAVLGQGVLKSFYVSDVDNPAPNVKSDSVDVPGANGSVYMTEASGRVTFEDKTVKVVLGGCGETANWNLFDGFKNGYQGRLCDFTFDDPADVKWFQTGRVSIELDDKLCTFTLTFTEVPPFRYSTNLFYEPIYLRTNYEKYNNADAWSFSGSAAYRTDFPGDFVYLFNSAGGTYYRTKAVGAQPGAKMLFGVQTLSGGDVCFVDDNGNESRTYATACTPSSPTQEHPGELRMKFTVDGSYYEWKTVNNSRQYLPTIRCTYTLSNYVPIDSNGEIVNELGNGIVTHTFPTNVEIRPMASGSDGIIIVDGKAFNADLNSRLQQIPRLALPGVDAKKDGTNSKSVFCWVRSDNSEIQPGNTCRMCFIPVEVF